LQGLFLEYKDPLFGIIIFVSLIFIVTLASFLWNLYSQRYRNEHVESFVNNFKTTDKPQTIEKLLEQKELPVDALFLLAQTYFKASQYEICIEISIDILKRPKSNLQSKVLLLLAQSYYKAGFYKRSETALIELLRYNTYEPKALAYLVVIYERLQRFRDAIDALNALKEMDASGVDQAIAYIRVIQIIRDTKLSKDDQAKQLIEAFHKEPSMLRPVFMHLFRSQPKVAWQHFDVTHYEEILDILWNLPEASLDLDIIAQHKNLQALYFAKGYHQLSAKSDVFEVNVVNTLLENDKEIATLEFSYQCSECKEATPLMSHRCPHCLSLLTLDVQISVVQKHQKERYYSF
jgi:lipopolysaccharide biosynthesis regulator YciM